MEEQNFDTSNCQVLVTNIKWNKDQIGQYRVHHDKYETLPSQYTLDIPENVTKQAKSGKCELKEIVETFVFNFLSKKYGHEVNNCAIWLLTDDK